MAPRSCVKAVVSKARSPATRLWGVKLLPGKTTDTELALWSRQQRSVAEHFLAKSSEARWGLSSLSEFEGLACARRTISHGMFDFPGSHLGIDTDESYPESHLCPCGMA